MQRVCLMLPVVIGMALGQAWGATGELKGIVRGTVGDAGLVGAEVELVPEQVGAKPMKVVSDGEGKFVFRDVAEGSYRIAATKNGYLRVVYGARPRSVVGKLVVVREGLVGEEVVLRMVKNGAIQGMVVGEDGQAVEGVQVSVFEKRVQLGEKVLQLVNQPVLTNDLGEYRVGNVPAGEYFVLAAVMRQKTRAKPEGISTTFYPSATTLGSAGVVTVVAGQDARGVDVRMVVQRLVTVRGEVKTAVGGQAGQNAYVQMFPVEGNGPVPASVGYAQTDREGKFELSGVPGGRYSLLAFIRGVEGTLVGACEVMVGREDVEGLKVEVGGSEVTVVAKVVAWEGEKAAVTDLGRMRVSVYVPGWAAMRFGTDALGAAGKGTMKNVPRTKYVVLVTGVPEGLYVKSVMRGDQELVGRGAVYQPEADKETIQVVLGEAKGSVTGKVVNGRGEGVARAVVFVAPVGQPSRFDLHKRVVADEKGEFEVKGLAAGRYEVFGWEDVETGAMMDREFLDLHVGRSKRVEIEGAGRKVVELEAIVLP